MTLKLTKEERKWLMEQTLSVNMFKVFDSSEYSVRESREPFIDSIVNKYGIVVVMKDVNENVFGGFIRNRIVCWKTYFIPLIERKHFYKISTFVFRLRRRGKKDIEIFKKKEDKNDLNDFNIFSNDDEPLFRFGKNDITLRREICVLFGSKNV